jgi:chromosome segregation ATPase
MITFNCPHCGNQFRVKEELAGRDGWCRVCNGHIVIPGESGSSPITKMSDDEKVSHLEKSLRIMGVRYARHIEAMTALTKENESLREQLNEYREIKRSAQAAEARWKEAEVVNNRLSQEMVALAEDKGRFEERFNSADSTVQRLDRELEESRKGHEARESELMRELNEAKLRLTEGDSLSRRLKNELSQLEGRPGDFDERLTLLSQELERASRELSAERAAKDTALRSASQLEGRAAAFEQDREFLQNELVRAQERANAALTLEAELVLLRTVRSELSTQLERESAEIGRLKDQIHAQELAFEKRRNDLEKQLGEMAAVSKQHEDQTAKFREELVAMTLTAKANAEDSQRLRNELNTITANVGDTDSRVRELSEQLEVLGDDLKSERTAKAKAERSLKAAETRTAGLERQLEIANAERDRLAGQVERLPVVEIELGVARNKILELESRVAMADDATQAVTEARTAEIRAREDAARMDAELQAKTAEIAGLRKETAELQRNAALASVYREEKESLEERLNDLRDVASKLHTESAALQGKTGNDAAELERAMRDIAALKADLAAEKAARTASDSELRAEGLKLEYTESLSKSLQRELDESRSRLSRFAETEERLASSMKKLDESQELVARLTSEVSRLTDTITAAEARKDEPKKEPAKTSRAEKEPVTQTAHSSHDDIRNRDTESDDTSGDEDLTLIPEIIDELSQTSNDAMADALFRFIERE